MRPQGRLAIALVAILLVAGAWLFVIQQTRHERVEAVEVAVRENRNRAVALERYVTSILEAADMATLHVAELHRRGAFGSLDNAPPLPRRFSDPVVDHPAFAGISIANADGVVVASTMDLGGSHANVRGHPAFTPHLPRDSGRLFVGTPRHSERLGGAFIWLTRRLNNPDGSLAGVIAVNIAPDRLVQSHEEARTRPLDMVSVIGLDGITRARRTGDVVSFGEDLRGKLVMRRQMADPNGTYLGPSALDGRVRYFSHRRLREFPLFATSGVALAQIMAPVEKRSRASLAGACLFSLVVVGLAGLFIFSLDRRQKRAQAMAEINWRLEEAQRIAQIGDWEYELATGTIRWSPQLCRMYERDEANGTLSYAEFEAYLDQAACETLARGVARAIETGERQEYTFDVTLPSKAVSHRHVVLLPTLGEDGSVVRLHGTDQDVSSRRLLDMLQQEVAHLSRVEAMNAMAATLAHELNQPLTASANYLAGSRRHLAALDAPSAQTAREGMKLAEQQVQLAAKMIRRVRAMVANQPRADEIASLREIIDDSVSLVRAANAYPRLSVGTDIAVDADLIGADRVQIQQVLMNLIRNAAEATDGTPRPHIRVRSRPDDQERLVVSVADNGPGIPDHAGDLFSPFATSKQHGLGLGLSISRTIVEANGGRIWVEATGPSGTEFRFTVPRPVAEEPRREVA